MATLIKPNGKPGVMEIQWSWFLKVVAGVVTALAAAGVIGVFRLTYTVNAMQTELQLRVEAAKEEHKRYDEGLKDLHSLERHVAALTGEKGSNTK